MTTRPPQPLDVREAYPLWAAGYDLENPVTMLDLLAVAELSPPVVNRRLLDAACGTGRRLTASSIDAPALAVGLDLSWDMLLAGRGHLPDFARLIQADIRRLPVAPGTMDIIWCRLALSHVRDLRGPYGEFRRVAASGATLIVTDFHPTALRAGHRRTFRGADGVLRAVESHPHTPDAHTAAARAVGFSPTQLREYRVGPQVRPLYEAASYLDRYEEDLGLPLVFGLAYVGQ
ncbi:MAG: class I SAM-dependent methyltransferase [Gemmatimonadetes bacterium]|nr:class I SAM-dependent methyltransferase [Gemmatimonadota bacterium]